VRGLPPPLVKDDVMDLNHELRFPDFWKSPKEFFDSQNGCEKGRK